MPTLLGITGNVASGKSAVRQYLENEGALTIDADLLAQSTYLPGMPAYKPVTPVDDDAVQAVAKSAAVQP